MARKSDDNKLDNYYEEDYFFDPFDEETKIKDNKVYVLIIYDIVENKKRTKLAKFLLGYGFRIQKSCFEAILPENKFQKLLKGLEKFVNDEDEINSVRVYKFYSRAQVYSFGRQMEIESEDVIII